MTTEPHLRLNMEPARVALSEVSSILQEAAELSADRGAQLARRVAFHKRKAELFERLAANEPGNVERQVAARRARRQYEHYSEIVERVDG